MYNKSRTLSVPVSPEVAAFAVVMEARLALEGYDEVEKWEGISTEKLMKQLEAKAKRLAAADPTNATELFNKAVIIGNLAMMIADKAARQLEATAGPANHCDSVAPSETDLVPEAPVSTVAINSQDATNLPQSAKSPRQIRHRAFARQASGSE